MIVLAAGLALSASAQKYAYRSGFYRRPHVMISTGLYSPFYPYYGYYGYPYYPYGTLGYRERPTRLTMEIEDIHNDYQDKIWSARHDKSLSRQERKKTIHELKHERDQAISDSRRNYYKPVKNSTAK